ncbi:MAG: HDIG domain-containing metalloprotein [bacterium]
MISKEKYAILKTSKRIKVLIAFILIVLIVFMFPKGEALESEVNVGSIWIQDDLIASMPFEILKDNKLYEAEKKAVLNNVRPVFVTETFVNQKTLDSAKFYNKFLANTIDEDLINGIKPRLNKLGISNEDYEILKNLRKVDNSLALRNNKGLNYLFGIAVEIFDRVYHRGLLSIESNKLKFDSIDVREGKFEITTPKNKFFDKNSVKNFVGLYIKNKFSNNIQIINASTNYILKFLTANIIYSEKSTENARHTATDKVSKNIGIVNENERIVAKHDRITPEIKLKIDSYRVARADEIGVWGNISQMLGKFLHVVIILTLFVVYLYLFRKKIFTDNKKLLLISIIIVFLSFITFIMRQLEVTESVKYLIFIPVGSMLLTIIFDSRVGFYGTVVIALIAGGLRGNDYIFVVVNVLVGGLGAYTVRDIKNRTQIYRSFYFLAIAYLAGIVAFGLETFDTYDVLLRNSLFAGANAIISPALTIGLIIFIERTFKITTDLTLLEMTEFNSPLLRGLAQSAPGTFTHSISIGSLVENAASMIGANPILARVGAYYHDIGKFIDPESFVENQLNNENIHEHIEPKKSVELILKHVSNGIELAKKNNLPPEIIDFIPMHHGTMVISYFYDKAKSYYPEGTVNIDDYRYKGPKPNTKETSLLMIADACESAVRSMIEPDAEKIENMINNLVNQRLDDGQLDESPLTIRDIKIIKESFLNILVSQHHKRIRYPKQEELESNTKVQT